VKKSKVLRTLMSSSAEVWLRA